MVGEGAMETIESHSEWQLVKNEAARVCAATGMTIHSPLFSSLPLPPEVCMGQSEGDRRCL